MSKKDYFKLNKKSSFFDQESKEQFDTDLISILNEIHSNIDQKKLAEKKRQIQIDAENFKKLLDKLKSQDPAYLTKLLKQLE